MPQRFGVLISGSTLLTSLNTSSVDPGGYWAAIPARRPEISRGRASSSSMRNGFVARECSGVRASVVPARMGVAVVDRGRRAT
ncbi:hypothetical protein GCM10010123_30950 [Pilimelia anulata]|uniref:Uncharacterized protein n=1 Tax=Pilimelia anulata TaxID=53371 RepID=A0A8J3B718_9ACTN|nr:hypothetical protein GCM10010123_30950 [Pilimelia anulata]